MQGPDDHERGRIYEELRVTGEQVAETMRKLLHEGNVRRIIVTNEDGQTIMEVPVTVGVAAAIVAPLIAAVAVIGAMVSGLRIVVERVDTNAA
ncbi:MAG TPA: DUF4342 domain-containing protein [Actinomycetota bacterium]|nr:DUF4342 domain-containing protein [Actinomycetota bacterium]